MSNGSIKPATSLYLGLAVKSITGSRKMVEILNRMGYCISYTAVEEIETELAYGCSKEKKALPHGFMPNSPSLCTHLAFDNFDRYVETVSGKDTLHDTVGIVIQNIDSHAAALDYANAGDQINQEIVNVVEPTTRRRKYLSPFDTSIEPYFKGIKKTPCLIANEPALPQSLDTAKVMNDLWMFQHAFQIAGVKRWVAWNADRVTDLNPVQKIGYLPNMNASPTSDAVVKKTLDIAQNIAKECNQQHIIVTYDLAISCKAYRIKDDLFPTYENVFVSLGAFHTELSYFKVRKL